MKKTIYAGTMIIWALGMFAHAFYWTISILSQHDLYGYERSVILILMGFLVYRFPFWLAGGVLLFLILGILLTVRSKKYK